MTDKREWVDFKAVKAAVTIEMVLDHYGVTGLRRVGNELRGPCPIHRSTKTSKHLSVNPSKGAFKCFASACGAHGNVLDFVAAMENCSVRDAASKLAEWFKVGESQSSPARDPSVKESTDEEPVRGVYQEHDGATFEVVAVTTTPNPNFDELVVCRNLYGDFLWWVLPVSMFKVGEHKTDLSQPSLEQDARIFTLVKVL